MIIFLYGADTFRSHRKLKEIRQNFQDKVDSGASSISTLDGAKIGIKEIAEQINTGSLFVNKRLIIIEDFFNNKQEKIFTELKDYLEKQKLADLDDRNVLIFLDGELNTKNSPLKTKTKTLFGFLAGQKLSQEFKTLSPLQLNNFVKEELAKEGKTISPAAASELVARHQGGLWQISNEIKKLTYFKTEGRIESKDLEEIGSRAYGEDVFSFTDALGSRNKKLTVKLFEEQISAGIDIEQMLAMMIRHFKILIQVKSFEGKKTSGAIASEVGLHPFVVSKSLNQAKNFSLSELTEYFNRLVLLDYENKTGQKDLMNGLTLFMVSL
ncbi:MAG: DNA polymerase III subunit delta [Candidatus Falkowbacteria bacterium]|nr:DNA polymerase III subunit delta [Candidatus Falkowbacteria bacterium]